MIRSSFFMIRSYSNGCIQRVHNVVD